MKNLLVIMLVWFVLGGVVFALSYNNGTEFTDTQTIRVRNGDSLWSIAASLHDGSYNNNQVVSIIRDINDIDPMLSVGQELEVPVLGENLDMPK